MTKNMNDIAIETLVKFFFKGSLPNLKGEDLKAMTWGQQEIFLNHTIYSPLYKKYPSSCNFVKSFFKKLIESLEREQEVHNDIYEYLCSIMKKDEENNYRYRHYLIDNSLNKIVTIKETKCMVQNGTTGLRTWEAALILSDWALSNNEIFLNKTVLELGSGVGFTGITIAKFCDIKNIVMTDCHEEVLVTINNNIKINFPTQTTDQNRNSTCKNKEKNIGVLKLDWNDTANFPQNLVPDVVIGADIVYDPSILHPLIKVFEYLQNRNKNVDIYIASVIRNPDTFNEFLKNLESSHFKHTSIPLTKNVHIEWDENIARCLLRINK